MVEKRGGPNLHELDGARLDGVEQELVARVGDLLGKCGHLAVLHDGEQGERQVHVDAGQEQVRGQRDQDVLCEEDEAPQDATLGQRAAAERLQRGAHGLELGDLHVR